VSRHNRAIIINGFLAALSFLGGVVANIATGTLPEEVNAYSWLFWALTAVFAVIVVWLTIASTEKITDADAEAAERAILLSRVEREVRVALEDRLPSIYPKLDQHFSIRSLPLPRPDMRLEYGKRRLPNRPVVPAELFIREGGLLLLGAPGAGKTTELWLLAEHLHTQAAENPSAPIPLFLNLSSWGAWSGTFQTWIVEQLEDRYKIAKGLAQHYLNTSAVTLLFDGLDEVDSERRDACISELNSFANNAQKMLAVCSRIEECDKLKSELALPTIVIEPLTTQQVETYLDKGSVHLRGLVIALNALPLLRELVGTPLWLSISAEAFADEPQVVAVQSDPAMLKATIWDSYITRMITRAKERSPYNESQIRHYLGWLSRTMQNQGLSELFLERMQSTWLDTATLRCYRIHSKLAGGLAGGLVGGLAGGLAGGLLIGLVGGLAGMLAFGLVGSNMVAASFGQLFFWRALIFIVLVFGSTVERDPELIFVLCLGLVVTVIAELVDGSYEPVPNSQKILIKTRLYSKQLSGPRQSGA
jgi:hypothetical protein